MSTQTLHFSVTGEFLTEHARDRWVSDTPKNAIDFLLQSLPGMTKEQALLIITGKHKLSGSTNEGDGTVYAEEDNTESVCGIRLDVQTMIDRLEKKFVETLESKSIYAEAPAGTIFSAHYEDDRESESEYKKAQLKKSNAKLKELTENLEVLYPLVGKTMSELPFDKAKSYSELVTPEYHCFETTKQRAEAAIATAKMMDKIRKPSILDKASPSQRKLLGLDNEYPLLDNFLAKQKRIADSKTIDVTDELLSKVKRMKEGKEKAKHIRDILNSEGYNIQEKDDGALRSGVILANGMFVKCEYMEHINMYPTLYSLGLTKSSQWTDDDVSIHISSGQITLDIRYRADDDRNKLTEAQISTLFKFRKSLATSGFRDKSVTESLRQYTCSKESFGNKYNNLVFLKRCYPSINLPEFSKELFPTDNNKIFIRTSPKKSLPGLLNSKLIDNNNDTAIKTIDGMNTEFSKYIGLFNESYIDGTVKDNNKLFVFYQEFLEGRNGVANYHKKGDFFYSVSDEQGDIVKGKKGSMDLEENHEKELRSICSTLYEDIENAFQVEFVIHKDKLYIVQFRILENEPEEATSMQKPKVILATGFTFSKGQAELHVNEVLVVDSEADSKELIGKKALVVRDNVEFSHILALSKALKLPSIVGVGDFVLPSKFKLIALNKQAFITK